jgi:hypothetical protein
MHALRRALDHPLVDIVVSLILIATSLAEGWGTFRNDLMTFDAGVHHGVLIFGFVNMLRPLPKLLEAAERTIEVSTEDG